MPQPALNILVVSQYFWPENFRVNELVAELVKRGHRVTVLTGVPNYPDGEVFADYQRHPQAFSQFEGAEIIRAPMLPRGTGKLRLMLNYFSFALGASLAGAWKLRGRPVDVIFTFEPSPITVGIPAAVIRALKGAPQAFWVLDLWPETLKAIGVLKKPWMLAAVGWLVRAIYCRCDLILAQSRSFVADIRRYAPQGRIEYFPAWAEAVFAANASPARPAPELANLPPAFTVLFAGNIGEAQDFPAILDAAEALKSRTDIRWAIVGDGRMAAWVKEQIAQRGLEQNLIMLGRHPLARMPEFYACAHALLVSLKDEPVFAMTIPGKMQSYFAAGLPVLAMLNGEGAQIVREANVGLVCPAGDSAGLAANVAHLVSLAPEQRQALGQAGRELCQKEFERDLLISRLEIWLAQLAAKKA